MSVALSLSTGMAMDAIVAALRAFTRASLNCRFAQLLFNSVFQVSVLSNVDLIVKCGV